MVLRIDLINTLRSFKKIAYQAAVNSRFHTCIKMTRDNFELWVLTTYKTQMWFPGVHVHLAFLLHEILSCRTNTILMNNWTFLLPLLYSNYLTCFTFVYTRHHVNTNMTLYCMYMYMYIKYVYMHAHPQNTHTCTCTKAEYTVHSKWVVTYPLVAASWLQTPSSLSPPHYAAGKRIAVSTNMNTYTL